MAHPDWSAQKMCPFAFADYGFPSHQRQGTLYITKNLILVAFLDNI